MKIKGIIFFFVNTLRIILISSLYGIINPPTAVIFLIISMHPRINKVLFDLLPIRWWRINKRLCEDKYYLFEILHDLRENFYFVDFFPRGKAITVIDVGAYIGGYSKLAASLLRDDGKVIAIEPNSIAYSKLITNIRRFNIKKIIPLNLLISSKQEIVSFFVPLRNYSKEYLDPVLHSSSIYARHLSGMKIKEIKVKATTLDELLDSLNISHIDLLKIDVEGAELEVLKGSMKTLKKNIVSKLMVEVHEDIVSIKDIINFLKQVSSNCKVQMAYVYNPVLYVHLMS